MLTKIFGDANEKELKKLQPQVEAINALEPEIVELSDDALRQRADDLKARIKEDGDLDDELVEAFALVRETARRTLGQRHFDVQLLGGIVMHQGKIVEMRTGEGKTLAATAPVALNAMTGRGVHVVTVNDFLAKRDTAWMGQVYVALGLSVGCITQEASFRYKEPDQEHQEEADEARDEKGSFRVYEEFLEEITKPEAYKCDITYGTNNEFGFDYLRSNMVLDPDDAAQREHYFAIVDEVDSILIDEARTPLIISAPDTEAPKGYKTFAQIAPRLKPDLDFEIDEKRRAVLVNETGIEKVEKWLGIDNLYEEGYKLVHFLEQALRAQFLYARDKEYIVKDGEVIIVDEFTGRLMAGRRWSEGLHQAVEAKEGVPMQAESRTLATITFQNYFRMYEKLSGMTGTAATSGEEFHKVYKLDVLVIPTNRPLIRQDIPDVVFRTDEGKWRALVLEVRRRHETGQPILIGTTSIEKNELVAQMLEREGIPHELLNAKQHAREGAILAQAGRQGAVTVATNMAGRGVDIILGGNPLNEEKAQEVCQIGGLAVFGTERHEARRIDNQLRGRCGRQGDPGASQFFLSLEDDLLRIFGGDKMQGLMERLNVPEDMPIESGIVSKAIESAQSRIEGQNFDVRKHLLEYDDVTNKHREAIYKRRRKLLHAPDVGEALEDLLEEEVAMLLPAHFAGEVTDDWDFSGFVAALGTFIPLPREAEETVRGYLESRTPIEERFAQVASWAEEMFLKGLHARQDELGEEAFFSLKRQAMLRAIDGLWVEHLEHMEALRDSVRLRAYGQRDPLVEYKKEAIRAFRLFDVSVRSRTLQLVMHAGHTHTRAAPAIANSKSQIANSATNRQGDAEGEPVKKKSEVGRNDPCPCGAVNPATGKTYKYKKCGLINAPHHKP